MDTYCDLFYYLLYNGADFHCILCLALNIVNLLWLKCLLGWNDDKKKNQNEYKNINKMNINKVMKDVTICNLTYIDLIWAGHS